MERENKKKGKGRERSEDQLVRKNGKKKRKLQQDVKHIYNNNNYNIISNIDSRKEDLDVNSSHQYYDIIHNDDDDVMSGTGVGVFDFPWLKKDREQEHGTSSSSSSSSMFNINADDNSNNNNIDHHPFFLEFEEYHYSTFEVPPASATHKSYDHHPHNIMDGDDRSTRVVAPAHAHSPNDDACYSSTTTVTSTTATTTSAQSSSAGLPPINSDHDDPNYKVDININNSDVFHELELDKMEYYIWSSVLDQPLDIGLFNKYL